MAGLDPAIHVSDQRVKKDVDARDERGHDVERLALRNYIGFMNSPAPAKTRPRGVASAGRPALLLAWYDRHRRRLPWRPLAGERADPYRVWLSEIMLQQTGVKTVGPYFEKFLARWPGVEALGRASLDDVLRLWAGLGYYSRARNLHACAVAVLCDHGGAFPDTEEGLRALPGIGPYTAAAIAAIAFGRRTMPVDGNIERVVSRLFAVEQPLPQAKPLIRQLAATLLGAGDEQSRAGDSAQALMDLGSSICTPKKPACALCPLNDECVARARGEQEVYPRKAPKKTGALRRGAAFVVTRGDQLLVRSRPEKGLLGGMTEVPGSDWLAAHDDKTALKQAPALSASSSTLISTEKWVSSMSRRPKPSSRYLVRRPSPAALPSDLGQTLRSWWLQEYRNSRVASEVRLTPRHLPR